LNNEKILKHRFPVQQKQIRKLGTQTGTIMYIGVQKISMQFMKFLYMALISASGVRGVTAGEKAGSQFLMEGSSTCNNNL
jgi:hypothetical protein